MRRKPVKRKAPAESVRLGGLKAVRLMALITQTRGILRPTAHRELREFVATARSGEELGVLLKWGAGVVEADFHERYSLFRPRTKRAVIACPLPVFSQPKRAFKVRWMYRPRRLGKEPPRPKVRS